MKSERQQTTSPAGLVAMETGDEVYREYDFVDPVSGEPRVYRIDRPVSVEYQIAGTTHRVADHNDVWHVLPAPGYCGCVIRFKMQPDTV